MGQLYKNRMSQRGVIPLMTETNAGRTGEVVCLISPGMTVIKITFFKTANERCEPFLVVVSI